MALEKMHPKGGNTKQTTKLVTLKPVFIKLELSF